MTLSLEQVRHVATLARLSLTPEEESSYRVQLSAILEAMEKLRSVETGSVAPTQHADLREASGAHVRDDVVQPSLPAEKSLANAPSKVGTSFAVPKIIE